MHKKKRASFALALPMGLLLGVAATGCAPAQPTAASAGSERTQQASNTSQPAPSTVQKSARSDAGSASDAAGKILDHSKPVRLKLPTIGVNTTNIIPLGIQPNGKIEVPERNDTVGWYKNGPTPGEFGPAVMGGHVDSDAGPAIFWALSDMQPGDKAVVTRADGETAVFTVYDVQKYPKDQFPTQKVYAPTNNRAELRLITCGGSFNEKIQSYRSNIVVYAEMTAVR